MNLREPPHYAVILERLARRIWNSETYFVVVPCTFFLGHLFWEIIAATSLARRNNKVLVLLKPKPSKDYHVVNSAVFECTFDCRTEKSNVRDALMTVLDKYETVRVKTGRLVAALFGRFLSGRISPPVRRFHRCGVEESAFVLAKIRGTRNYYDLSVLPDFAASIRLTETQKRNAEAILRDNGVALDRWFAVAHVRESSFRGRQDDHDARNFSQYSILPVVKAVASQGGVVVRMGTPQQSFVPPTEGLFDYARSKMRSDLMDMYLTERASFYVGASSGPHVVAWAFGKPAFVINAVDFLTAGFRRTDMFIPKMIFDPKTLEFLSLSDYCSSASRIWNAKDYWYIDNTLTDIEDAFQDFQRYVRNGFTLAPDEAALQKEWHDIRNRALRRIVSAPAENGVDESFKDMAIATMEAPAVVAPSFLRKYLFTRTSDSDARALQKGVTS